MGEGTDGTEPSSRETQQQDPNTGYGRAGPHRRSVPLLQGRGIGDPAARGAQSVSRPRAQSLARTQRDVITAKRPRQGLGHHCLRAPLQALTRRSNVPTSEGTRSPPATQRRRGPSDPTAPLLGWVRTPGSRAEARGRLGGRGRGALCIPPSPRVTDTGRLCSLSTREPSGSPTRYLKDPEVLPGRYHSGRNWTGTVAPRSQNPGQGSGGDP